MSFQDKIIGWLNPVGDGARRKRMLRLTLFSSLCIHALIALLFGGAVLVKSMMKEEVVFEAPPPVQTYEPRKIELKVKVQQKQRSSSRPQVVPRMVSSRPSTVTLPDIKVDPKLVTTTFQPKFKAVTGVGMGVGLGTGYGTSGFGQGVSQVNFFGIRATGERIAICVDVSVSMVEDERGGIPGFLRVKQRVNEVIDALAEGTLFNVIAFADGCSMLDTEKMMYSSPETRSKAKNFLGPFNTEGNYGLDSGNYTGFAFGGKGAGGTTRLDLAIGAAMSQGADTILVISDGLPKVKKGFTEAQLAAHRARLEEWTKANAAAIAAHQAAVANAPTRRVWVPEQPARPPTPPRPPRPPAKNQSLKEGQKPDRGDPGSPGSPGTPAKPGYWKEVRDVPPGPKPPSMGGDGGSWTLADFFDHIDTIYKEVYVQKGLKMPKVHCIGYQIDAEGRVFLEKLAAHYKGQFRLVNRMR
jgi:hypothetical protein